MQLKIQKRLAAQILKTSQKNIWLDENRLEEIKESITKNDIKSLIKDKAIKGRQIMGISRYRARARKIQKMKGRRSGAGSKKGGKYARLSRKTSWMMIMTLNTRPLYNEGEPSCAVMSHTFSPERNNCMPNRITNPKNANSETDGCRRQKLSARMIPTKYVTM